MRLLILFAIGLIFGFGISLSGMINPAKVLNFFDIFGTWDPSLAFVMAGALAVTIPGYFLVQKRGSPLFGDSFHMPANRKIDKRLVIGSAMFGIGWGIAGFCPGAAVPALGLLNGQVILFLAALVTGIGCARIATGETLYPAVKLFLKP